MTNNEPRPGDAGSVFQPLLPPILGEEEMTDLVKKADQAAADLHKLVCDHARAVLGNEDKEIVATYGAAFKKAIELERYRGLMEACGHSKLLLAEKAHDAFAALAEPVEIEETASGASTG